MNRQIDSMTPNEIEVLQLKGMTAPRTASEGKPILKAFTDPAPNKAQPQGLYIHDIEVANYCDKLKAHADKLAEALRHLIAITRNEDSLQYKVAVAQLKAYEAAQ